MQKWEEKIIDWEKGKAEGKALAVIELLTELGDVPEVLCAQIMTQSDQEVLSVWLKKAAKAASMKEFIDLTGLRG